MKTPPVVDNELAQHESSRLHWFELERRDFLKLAGGGILICLAAPSAVAQESGRASHHELPTDIAGWLQIAEDGHVTVFTGKVELGQNIRTSLAQQVAEELRVPVASISMVMGDTDRCPWDAGTFGSRTTPTMGPQLRAAAAAARTLLLELAAQRWHLQSDGLLAANARVTNPKTNHSLSFAELIRGQKLTRTIPSNPPLTAATDWKIAGTPVPKVDGRKFVTGKHEYTSDMVRPGMVYGKILRPSGFKAKLTSLDTSDADKIAGVKVVRDAEFVGVVAPDAWSAELAVRSLKGQWDVPAQPSDKELFEYLKKNAEPGDDEDRHVVGSVDSAMATADAKQAATYTVEYIAHAPLEPRAAVAEWNGERLTVWTGTQRPFAVRDELAAAFRIPPAQVHVLMPDTGSAYGGKHTGDAAVEAARLAKAAGKPVKVTWTREEEFTWAYFRPAGVIEAKSGARRDGKLVAWEFHNYNSGPAGIGTPYDVPNQTIIFHPVASPLRQGSYRALAATANNFAREAHIDELAHELNLDPLQFRLKNLTDDRLRAVFEAAAEEFGWDQLKSTPQRGFGIAGAVEKGGRVATCVEVQIDRKAGAVRIQRIVEAFECGAVVNPNGLRNQITGAIVQGLGGALFEAVSFQSGRILNPHFAQYLVPRFSDVPPIDVVVLNRKDLPSTGAGETPILGLAPAVANAIFAATGRRLRSLPLLPEGSLPTTQSEHLPQS